MVSVDFCVVGALREEKAEWEKYFNSILTDVCKDNDGLKFVYSPVSHWVDFRQVLQRSELCVLPLKKESTLFGVEALMAGYAGVPLLVAENSGIAGLLGQGSLLEMNGTFQQDVESWTNRTVAKILNANNAEDQAL